MKRCLALPILAFVCVPLLSGWSEDVDVRAFGAKGDGKTDDTQAIQAAFDAVAKKVTRTRKRADGVPGRVLAYSSPAVHFPAGQYLVSETIQVKGHVITGERYAALNQADPDKDIFATRWAHYLHIQGLAFVGGAIQLNLYNGNLSGGVVTVEDCQFWQAGKWALYVDIESTTFTMQNCHIYDAMQGMYINRSDVVMARDCWWVNHKDMKNCAFIVNKGQRVCFENICANPRPNGFDQRWLDNYSKNLTMRQIRFGGEGGGFTPVVNYRQANPLGVVSSITIEDSWCCNTSNAKRQALVYCEEVPNIINLRGNTVTSEHLVQMASRIDLRTYFKELKIPRSQLAFQAEANVGGLIDQRLPKGLQRPAAAPDVPFKSVSKRATRKLVRAAIADWEQRLAGNSGPSAPAEIIDPKSPFPYKWDGIAAPDVVGAEHNGHYQKTDPADYREVTLTNAHWDASEQMDATRIRNSEFFAFAEAGTDLLFVWKREGQNWPHFTVKVKGVDLDAHPWLTWRDKRSAAPPGAFVRVILRDAGITANVGTTTWTRNVYRARNLKEALGVGGVQDLELRFYPKAQGWVSRVRDQSKPNVHYKAAAGSYGVLDFIRFETD